MFLGFPLGSFVCFFRLISGEAGFNWSIRSGQPRFISTVGFIGCVWHARRRLFTTLQPFYHSCAYKLTMCSGLILHCCNFSANHPRNILIFIHLLPVPISIRQTISSTLPDHPTDHTLQFRAYLILVICKRLWATCFICNRPICPSLLPFIIIKHDLTHRLGPPSSSASFLFFCSELDFLLYHVSVSLHCITCTPSIHYHASFTIVWESTYTILF